MRRPRGRQHPNHRSRRPCGQKVTLSARRASPSGDSRLDASRRRAPIAPHSGQERGSRSVEDDGRPAVPRAHEARRRRGRRRSANARRTASAFSSPTTRNTTCAPDSSAGIVSVTRSTNGSRPGSASDRQAFALVQGGRVREQRCGVAVRAEAEQDEVERLAAQLGVVGGGSLVRRQLGGDRVHSRVDDDPVEQRVPHEQLVGERIVRAARSGRRRTRDRRHPSRRRGWLRARTPCGESSPPASTTEPPASTASARSAATAAVAAPASGTTTSSTSRDARHGLRRACASLTARPPTKRGDQPGLRPRPRDPPPRTRPTTAIVTRIWSR